MLALTAAGRRWKHPAGSTTPETPVTETFETKSVRGTISLGKKLAKRLGVGSCLGLRGQLGAGKTVLIKGLVAGLGLDETKLVRSPTFVLVHEYSASVPVFHLDLYRLEGISSAGQTN